MCRWPKSRSKSELTRRQWKKCVCKIQTLSSLDGGNTDKSTQLVVKLHQSSTMMMATKWQKQQLPLLKTQPKYNFWSRCFLFSWGKTFVIIKIHFLGGSVCALKRDSTSLLLKLQESFPVAAWVAESLGVVEGEKEIEFQCLLSLFDLLLLLCVLLAWALRVVFDFLQTL